VASKADPIQSVRPSRGRISAKAGTEPPCAHVSAREASYLLALRDLNAAPEPPTQVALARAMGVAAPTALEMVRRLRRLGLIEPEGLALTNEGISAALLLASRRYAADLLTRDLLGLDPEAAEPEAAQLAPNLSPALTRWLIADRGAFNRRPD
jgi:Mn-dependent DtxR family transcriptional regulator